MKISKKVVALVFVFLFTVVIATCGIMADIYFKEPTSLSIVSSDPQAVELNFTAENQEKAPNDDFLLAGYDVYYYFDSESNKKKAMVRYPIIGATNNADLLITLVNSDLTNSALIRLPSAGGFSDTLYQDITLPVTNTMINDLLGSGRSGNVKLYFDNRLTSGGNPQRDSVAIMLDELYPNYTTYYTKSWGDFKRETPDVVDDFAGFYDKDFYDNVVPASAKVSGTTDKYKVNFFVIAKGFNSNETRDKTLFIVSVRSNTVTVTFQIKSGT